MNANQIVTENLFQRETKTSNTWECLTVFVLNVTDDEIKYYLTEVRMQGARVVTNVTHIPTCMNKDKFVAWVSGFKKIR